MPNEFDGLFGDNFMNPGRPGSNAGNTGGGWGFTPARPNRPSLGNIFGNVQLNFPKPPVDPNAPKPPPKRFSWEWIEGRNQAARDEALKTLREGMAGVTGGLDQFTADYVKMISDMEARQAQELGTQVGEGRSTIDEATQRAMQEISAAGNPYANLRMATMPEVENPLASYMSDSGASGRAVNQLSQLLNQGNVGAGAAFQNLANILGASGQASAASRATDVQLGRAAALRDLEANRRGLSYQISTNRNMAEMEQRRAANEASRAAALQSLQQELAIGQQFDQQDSQFILTMLQLMSDPTNRNRMQEILNGQERPY